MLAVMATRDGRSSPEGYGEQRGVLRIIRVL